MPSYHVLIADRDETLAGQYQKHLAEDGFEVTTVTTGQGCAELLPTYRPDVLVLDADLLCGRDEVLAVLSEVAGLPLSGLVLIGAGEPDDTLDLWYVANKVSLTGPVSGAQLAEAVCGLLGIVPEKVQV
jgi:DNA-binding response OmpR family regulator